MFYSASEDFDLIVASFAAQYGIRLLKDKLTWNEFSSLLSGIMPETPLGRIIEIRSENDQNTLKNFNKEQHRIRNQWRNRGTKEMSREQYEQDMAIMSAAFRSLA